MFSNTFLAITDVNSIATSEALTIGGLFAGMLAFLATFMLIAIIIGVAVYVYTSLVMYTIAKKLKYKNAWLAWIPIANIAMILQLGDFHWALVFLILVPILGWLAITVLMFIAMWRIFEKRKYPGWLVLIPLASAIPILGFAVMAGYLVLMGVVAWKDK